MNVCNRPECQTTAGCAHRGPRGEFCWFRPAMSAADRPLRCPFCGQPPNWTHKSMAFGTGASGAEPDRRALACTNVKCPVQPHTRWRDTEEWRLGQGYIPVNFDEQAIADWNTRHD